MNRRLISQMTTYHFAPTKKAAQKLHTEGFQERVWNVGNTGIDALYATLKKTTAPKNIVIDPNKKIIFVTAHRRENHGEPMIHICQALQEIVKQHPDCQIIFPVHKNPKVQDTVSKYLSNTQNILLTEPLDYPSTVWLLSKSYLILTDSGGLQEEAPALNKPVLVMRDETERTEGVMSGAAKLVGTNPSVITEAVTRLLRDEQVYTKMANANSPYGNGTAATQIWHILRTEFAALR